METVKNKIAYCVCKNTNLKVGDIISPDETTNRNSNRLKPLSTSNLHTSTPKQLIIHTMEEVRKEINHKLPAKQNSLYVTSNLEDNKREFNKIMGNANGVSLQNVKLKLNGEWHKVACTSEENRILNQKELRQQMINYWTGVNGDYYMYLFQDEAIVLEIMDEVKISHELI